MSELNLENFDFYYEICPGHSTDIASACGFHFTSGTFTLLANGMLRIMLCWDVTNKEWKYHPFKYVQNGGTIHSSYFDDDEDAPPRDYCGVLAEFPEVKVVEPGCLYDKHMQIEIGLIYPETSDIAQIWRPFYLEPCKYGVSAYFIQYQHTNTKIMLASMVSERM